ncbi:MAG: class E sortase [Acidimicrobiales bacterium]
MSFSTIRVTVGRVVLVAGILVLLFIPYLLWGTGLITAKAQSDLRREFAVARRVHHDTTTLRPPATPDVPPVVAPTIAAPAVGSPVGVLSIPKIALSMVVVEGTGTDQLRSGPGHYTGTPLPGEAGNVAIAGHRTTYLHPFYDLNELVPGDAIDILTVQGLFVYHVVSSQSVSPSDVSVVAATASPMLTLTTCTPRYSASQRLVVQADLVADVLSGTPAAAHPPADKAPVKAGAPAPTTIRKDWGAAIAWGVAVAALITAIWAAGLRLRGGRRAAAVGVGLVVWLVVVFAFFGALAPLLPASY